MSENKLASRGVLVTYAISVWSGRRQAKDEASEVTEKAKAVKDAASVSKNLMVGTSELGAIQSAGADIRQYIHYHTLPWDDAGTRFLPMTKFTEFSDGLDRKVYKFNEAVEDLMDAYSTLITAQAFKLGSMFKREDYPRRSVLRQKFGVKIHMRPVPDKGHFLIDAHQETVEYLQKQAEEELKNSLEAMKRDSWERLYEAVQKLNDATTPQQDGKPKRIYESTINNIHEVTKLLTAFNVDDDPVLEEKRKRLEDIMSGVTPVKLREDADGSGIRQTVREQTAALLDMFDFGKPEDIADAEKED